MSKIVNMKGEAVDPSIVWIMPQNELTCALRDARLWQEHYEGMSAACAYWQKQAEEWECAYERERATRLELIKQLALRPWYRRWI